MAEVVENIVGNTYRHIRRGTLYRILAESKVKINGEWHPSVVYTDAENRWWVRTQKDFFDGKFDLVKES